MSDSGPVEERSLAALRSTLAGGRSHFDAIADAMPHFVWLAEPDGTVTFFNRRWVQYTGLTVEDLQQRGIKGVVHPADRDDTMRRWTAALETGAAYEMEYRLRNIEDGSYRWFLARALPVLDESGRNPRWIGTATDIDDQKRSRESLEFVLKAVSAFGASLNVHEICDRFATLAVEHFADWCFVMLFEEPDIFTTVAAAHKDPKRVDEVREFQRNNALRRRPAPVVEALRRGATLVPRVTDEQIRAAASTDEHLAIIRGLKMYSVMVVPLQSADGEFYGAITFVSAESRRSFTPTDLSVAEKAAGRAAAAIRTARVFDEERRTTQRLQLLSKATDNLFESLDLDGTFQRLTELLVSEIAACALVMTVEGKGLRTVAAAHRDKGLSGIVGRLRGARILQPRAERFLLHRFGEHKGVLTSEQSGLTGLAAEVWPHLFADVAALGLKSGVTIPIHSRGKTLGGLFVFNDTADRAYDQHDLPILVEIANRAAIAIENAESFERERTIAATLQKASLPSVLPSTPDLRFDGVYTPTAQGGSVGGDWYDAIELDDGSVMISVGDVAGSGLKAAVIMSKVRHVIAVGPLHQSDPSKILDAADWILRYRFPDAVVTAFVGIISADRKGMRFANAGHPSPLIRHGVGLTEARATGLPLGLRRFAERSSTEWLPLHPDDVIVLYTDGLTEWNHDFAEGDRCLRAIASSDVIRHAAKPAQLIHDVCLSGPSRDDVAVMTVTIGATDSWSFEAENALAAQDARPEFMEYVRGHLDDEHALAQAELVFGELMANVVQHAPGSVSVYVDWRGTQPVVHVIDRGKPFRLESVLPDSMSESGRGLYLIRAACDDVHVERLQDYGNHVSVALRAHRRP